jgi:predicted nucleic acid-binding Zn ribbon protein
MVRAQQVMPAVLAAAIRQAPLTPEKVSFAWRAAGGAAIARATSVTLGDDGVLVVSSDDPQWGHAVRKMRGQLLRQLEPWLGAGTVTRIELAQGAAYVKRRRPPTPAVP